MSLWTNADVGRALAALEAELPAAIELRHELHSHPDLSGSEGPTTLRLLDALDATGSPDVHGGRVVRIGGDGPAIGLRAELDALPLVEQTGLPWASTNGASHACGHDVHMAALVAVVRALRSVDAPLPVVAVLQPREEAVPSGAADLVRSQALLSESVGAMIGVHVQPRLAAGTFSSMAGAVNASSDDFRIVLRAMGGHAGYPHVTGDPVLAASEVVVSVQALVSRRVSPLNPAVVTVGSIHAGHAPNVIPDVAVLEGTIRTFDSADRELLGSKLRQVVERAATVHDCSAEFVLNAGEPPLINDGPLANATERWIGSLTARVPVDLRSCGSDDFSYYGEMCPSVMVFYGLGDAELSTPGLHHPAFAPSDDEVRGIAECLLAGYFAGCELLLGAPADS